MALTRNCKRRWITKESRQKKRQQSCGRGRDARSKRSWVKGLTEWKEIDCLLEEPATVLTQTFLSDLLSPCAARDSCFLNQGSVSCGNRDHKSGLAWSFACPPINGSERFAKRTHVRWFPLSNLRLIDKVAEKKTSQNNLQWVVQADQNQHRQALIAQ